jgi:CheY-like chemotaxis protein
MSVILAVEDETLVRDYLTDILEEAGYQVVSAANADEAIEILESRNDIRILITDVNMPGSMDGLRLACAVKDRWPPIKIIIATGREPPRSDAMPIIVNFCQSPICHIAFSRRSVRSTSPLQSNLSEGAEPAFRTRCRRGRSYRSFLGHSPTFRPSRTLQPDRGNSQPATLGGGSPRQAIPSSEHYILELRFFKPARLWLRQMHDAATPPARVHRLQ